MNWRDYWDQDTPIYVSERHKSLHYAGIARDLARIVPSPPATILDHGCGEALAAQSLLHVSAHLYLLDAAPMVRERLKTRFQREDRISVLAPENLETIPQGSLDVVIANSLLQYLSLEEFRSLLVAWREKLKPRGILILADVIPPDVSPITDAKALLSFAWKGGFLKSAILGLARTALSDYRKIRDTLGLSQYREDEMVEILSQAGFAGERLRQNIGHNQARMTFRALKA